MTLGRGGVREAEGRRGGDDHRDPVRDERVVADVARRLVDVLEARDRIGARVRDVHARRAEADARHRRREHHRAARLDVPGDRVAQEAPAVLERLRRPDVGHRVRPLVGRPVVGGGRGVPGGVRQRQIGLGRVADDVQPGRGRDLRRHRGRERRVDDRLRRPQVAVRDAGLHAPVRDVQHRDRGRLAPGPRRGRDREVRQQRTGGLHAAADRRVDVVHHRRGVRDDQVRDLGGVDRRAAADGDEAVDARVQREVRGGLQRVERRLDPHAVERDHLHTAEVHAREVHARIGDEQHARHAEPRQLPAGIGGRARPELDRRGLEGEDGLASHAASPTRLSQRDARAHVEALAALRQRGGDRVAALLEAATSRSGRARRACPGRR